MTDTLINFPTPDSDAALEAKAAVISQRIAEKLALEHDFHVVEQAIMLRYIAATKLLQGAHPLPKQAQIARQLAKMDTALRELGEALAEIHDEAKASREHEQAAPATFAESLALCDAKAETED